MKYIIAILIVVFGFWYWSKPETDAIYRGDGGHTMSDAEKVYYVQSFDYAMTVMPDGSSHPWESFNAMGTITPTDNYTSKSKAVCRHFTETFTIGGYEGSQGGVTCRRDNGSWCRLKQGNAETCALEKPGMMNLTFGGLDVGTVDLSITVGGVNIELPTTSGIRSPEMPDAPKGEKPDWAPRFEGRKQGQNSAQWLIQD